MSSFFCLISHISSRLYFSCSFLSLGLLLNSSQSTLTGFPPPGSLPSPLPSHSPCVFCSPSGLSKLGIGLHSPTAHVLQWLCITFKLEAKLIAKLMKPPDSDDASPVFNSVFPKPSCLAHPSPHPSGLINSLLCSEMPAWLCPWHCIFLHPAHLRVPWESFSPGVPSCCPFLLPLPAVQCVSHVCPWTNTSLPQCFNHIWSQLSSSWVFNQYS